MDFTGLPRQRGLCLRADEHRLDQAAPGGLDRTEQRIAVSRVTIAVDTGALPLGTPDQATERTGAAKKITSGRRDLGCSAPTLGASIDDLAGYTLLPAASVTAHLIVTAPRAASWRVASGCG
ncbi:MAG: hypothetical protein IPO61_07490 [Gammaproteobacteria bacterium]|nr:hypothetical protein [Gammaproteobacteria bacterium]